MAKNTQGVQQEILKGLGLPDNPNQWGPNELTRFYEIEDEIRSKYPNDNGHEHHIHLAQLAGLKGTEEEESAAHSIGATVDKRKVRLGVEIPEGPNTKEQSRVFYGLRASLKEKG